MDANGILAFDPPRDIDLLSTAKLMRAALARTFPGIKFSVRTSRYSMGCSADVSWTDGPTERQVRAETECFAYGGFDGMTDSSYTYGAWLCDEHGASFRSNTGTGYVAACDGGPCCLDAEAVRFGAKHVGQRRHLSPEFAQLIRDDIESVTGVEYDDNRCFAAIVLGCGDDEGKLVCCTGASEYGYRLFGQLAGNTAVTADREIRYAA